MVKILKEGGEARDRRGYQNGARGMAFGHASCWEFRKGVVGSAQHSSEYNCQGPLYNARGTNGFGAWIY